jgi:hypothetical protein
MKDLPPDCGSNIFFSGREVKPPFLNLLLSLLPVCFLPRESIKWKK